MANINFFDDPLEAPRAREDVRFNKLGFYVYPDGRRVAVGFDITPFIERPSIEVTARNESGEKAGSLTVIQTLDASFNLTMHLRDGNPGTLYHFAASIYYTTPDNERMVVHTLSADVDVTQVNAEIIVSGDSA